MRTILLVSCLALLVSCTRTPHTRDQLVGSYAGKVGKGSDSMLLKNDGTFDETLQLADGKSFENHGTWTLLEGDSIDLEHAFDLSSNFPPNSAVTTQGWVVPVHWEPKPIEFGANEYVWFVKESEAK